MNVSSQPAWRLCLVAIVVLLVRSSAAGAQTAVDQPTAEALFTAGRRLLAQGKYPEACSKFEESQRLDPAIGTLLNLGDCYEKSGKTASAWVKFREATEVAHRAGDSRREKTASQRVSVLEKRLSTLIIGVPQEAEVPGLVVKRDGVTMGNAVFGTSAPVDPGQHEIEATAPGKKPWSTVVTLDASHRSVAVSIPRLEDAPVEALPPPPPTVLAGQSPAASGKKPSRGQGQKVAAVVAAGTGLTAIGVGTIFGIITNGKKKESDLHCRQNLCDQKGVDLRDEALGSATVSTVTFGIGIAALVAAPVLWFTAPSSSARTRTGLGVAPHAGSGSPGATLVGVF
jgi:hypothetical protein